MTFKTSASKPARRRARYMAGGVAVVGLLATAIAGSGTAWAATPATAGSLDTAFGTAGIATASTPQGDGAAGMALQEPNGDIVVALANGLARFLPSGQLDPSFGTGGISASVVLVNAFAGLAVQRDGKILVSGVQDVDPAAYPATGFLDVATVTRINADGTLDTTFGSEGTAYAQLFTPLAVQESGGAQAILVQPDGKILLGGSAQHVQGRRGSLSISDGFVARLNPNGSADAGFGAGGTTLISSAAPSVGGLGLDAAGDIFALPALAQQGSVQGGVTELSPAGTVDAAVTPAPLSTTSAGYPVDATNDQFIVTQNLRPTASRAFDDVEVNRFTTAGTLASSTGLFTFAGASGTVEDFVQAAIVLPGGQALALGSHTQGTPVTGGVSFAGASPVFAFARVNPNGTLDATFGTGGAALTTLSAASGGFFALFPQSDGTVIAVGGGIGGNNLELARFNL